MKLLLDVFMVFLTCAETSGFGPSSSSLLANDAAVLKFLSCQPHVYIIVATVMCGVHLIE